ncbi:MAG: guanine deaminase, partial [Tannerellaceae bacterium]
IIAGKVAMNRNAHGALLEETDNSYNDSKELIEQWHEKGRALYAITPRFAISCDEQLMLRLGELHREYPTTYIHTHLSENKGEMTVVDALFPECKDYLQVYEEMGMLTERTIFAHGIHLSDSEMERIAKAGASIAHCPTSNLFLGSGLFDMKRANKMGVQVSIATDIGAGTSFSQLQTLNEAYKVQQLQHYSMSPFESFYHITLGAAKALKLDHLIGSFADGKEADFVVIDPVVTSLQRMRSEYMQRASLHDIESILFGVQMTGDDRNIRATYIMGECVYDQTIKQQ